MSTQRNQSESIESGNGVVSTQHAAAFRARQLQAIVDVTPWVVLSNIINAVVTLRFLLPVWPEWVAIAWFIAVVVVGCMGIPYWSRSRGNPLHSVSERTTWRVVGHAILISALWALIPAIVFAEVGPSEQLFIVAMATGMLCGGAFTLAILPRASHAYVVTLSIGSFIGCLQMPPNMVVPFLAVLAMFMCILFAVTASIARSFRARLVAEAAAAQQQELVSLLLNDFQEHTSDWFWETDARGQLCNVSPRIVSVFGVAAVQLDGRGLVSLLVERSGDESHSVANLDDIGRLQAALLTDQPFRALQVSVHVKGVWRRWLISGKPMLGKRNAIIGWRGVCSDITATYEAHAEVKRLATTDEVTGLANRHAFKRALQRVGAEPASLFYLDLDNFKAINDVHGHAVGDKALQAVAERLRDCIRPLDLLARVGGDEFAVLRFGNTDRHALERDAKMMCDALTQPCIVGSLRFVIGTSIGIAQAPRDAATGESLLRCTDLAVYESKDTGRGTWRFYTQDLGERAARRHRLQDDLRDGLHLDQFEVYYQPQFHAFDGRMIGAEALVRWHHPTRGDISPVEFIAAAEESGVIGTLGRWVLERACEAAMRWPSGLRIAVNVSAQQLVHPNWVRQVRDVLESTGLSPERLELELTETALIENTAVAMAAIVRLRALGVRIALDDFGTGYSSLAYLRRFPFDKIKIDHSFVVGITRDPGALAIVSAVARLASALQLEVTAEGVENNEQTKLLRELGCTSLQGFLLARPMSVQDMQQYVASEYSVPGLPGALFRHIDSITGEVVAQGR
ncbi:MAG TPA: EAL domain-containing protein [Steroidobacteraceae bacterium]|nr:EAL domain-containing protein [Steroidobacteraceae bacterium]